ncbi:ATP-grasp domain-containing protein [Nocardia terpenica]|uniref:Phosphoribosylglycinamide synthetase n=1 Tax=Nocardia terpenica TaxID=455432 RepID=A0A0U1Z2J8_9NOCA|nr:ATP-grasp domain-containing protein [Nocardia terpenica]AJO72765.1 Phosphoribosylglycinamide synthetase [Nocardia terpenica]KZM75383.1 phosphoribosylglycinamide synthetase [Nocardia terpenica]MBF6063774.1 ATP-grasp domain-containing protein [Nocardia terpenica]MBF6107150.1 ATP-grasp domain-containing protein [Nocardia terpenica]MBF6114323.1 ATP-grasp domain-containing protein [Nocardia terpenica]
MSSSVLFVNLRRIKREGLESLLAARRLGHRVILLGRALPEFAQPLVHEFHQVDTYDLERSLKLAREIAGAHDIVGVPNFTEIDVQLVSAIAADLGLPGLSAQAALSARNKYAMKQALSGVAGVLPRYARVSDLAELRNAVADIGFPVVVKPTGASGSKGILELRTEADLEPAMALLQRIADPAFDPVFRQFGAEFIVEEYLTGTELSVEGFVAGGVVHQVAVTDKVTTEPFHLELSHRLPSVLPAAALAEIRTRTEQIVGALGFDNCAFHLEAKWGEHGMRFIEVAARPAGDYIASHLVPLATGIDFFANVIRVSTGEPLRLTPDREMQAGLRFVLAESAGRFDGLTGLADLVEDPGYHHVFTEVPVGADVALPPDNFGTQRVAAICARHTDRAGLDRLLDTAGTAVTATVTGGRE